MKEVSETRGRTGAYGLEDFRFAASLNQRPSLDIYSSIACSIVEFRGEKLSRYVGLSSSFSHPCRLGLSGGLESSLELNLFPR